MSRWADLVAAAKGPSHLQLHTLVVRYGESSDEVKGFACFCAENGDTDTLMKLIELCGVDINTKNDRREALLALAGLRGRVELVRYLTLRGADVTDKILDNISESYEPGAIRCLLEILNSDRFGPGEQFGLPRGWGRAVVLHLCYRYDDDDKDETHSLGMPLVRFLEDLRHVRIYKRFVFYALLETVDDPDIMRKVLSVRRRPIRRGMFTGRHLYRLVVHAAEFERGKSGGLRLILDHVGFPRGVFGIGVFEFVFGAGCGWAIREFCEAGVPLDRFVSENEFFSHRDYRGNLCIRMYGDHSLYEHVTGLYPIGLAARFCDSAAMRIMLAHGSPKVATNRGATLLCYLLYNDRLGPVAEVEACFDVIQELVGLDGENLFYMTRVYPRRAARLDSLKMVRVLLNHSSCTPDEDDMSIIVRDAVMQSEGEGKVLRFLLVECRPFFDRLGESDVDDLFGAVIRKQRGCAFAALCVHFNRWDRWVAEIPLFPTREKAKIAQYAVDARDDLLLARLIAATAPVRDSGAVRGIGFARGVRMRELGTSGGQGGDLVGGMRRLAIDAALQPPPE